MVSFAFFGCPSGAFFDFRFRATWVEWISCRLIMETVLGRHEWLWYELAISRSYYREISLFFKLHWVFPVRHARRVLGICHFHGLWQIPCVGLRVAVSRCLLQEKILLFSVRTRRSCDARQSATWECAVNRSWGLPQKLRVFCVLLYVFVSMCRVLLCC